MPGGAAAVSLTARKAPDFDDFRTAPGEAVSLIRDAVAQHRVRPCDDATCRRAISWEPGRHLRYPCQYSQIQVEWNLVQGTGLGRIELDHAQGPCRSHRSPPSGTGISENKDLRSAAALNAQTIRDVRNRAWAVWRIGWAEREIRQHERAFPNGEGHVF